MTSEVEQRPGLVTAGYGWHGSQWDKYTIDQLGHDDFESKRTQAKEMNGHAQSFPFACVLWASSSS